MLCKLVRTKLAGPALPAKFKRSSLCMVAFGLIQLWIGGLLPLGGSLRDLSSSPEPPSKREPLVRFGSNFHSFVLLPKTKC